MYPVLIGAVLALLSLNGTYVAVVAPPPPVVPSNGVSAGDQEERLENLRFAHAMQLQRQKAKSDAINLVLDKVALAIIAAVAGVALNAALERLKSSLAVNADLEKLRVSAIADAWKAMYEWERHIDAFRATVSAETLDASGQRRLRERLSQLKLKAEETRQQVEHNQFWIGTELYGHLRDYHNMLIPLLSAYVARDAQRAAILHRRLLRSKQHVVLQTSAHRYVGSTRRGTILDALYEAIGPPRVP